MMELFEAIEKRRSVRTYQQTPVEKEKLEKVLDAARRAPSACNFQEWRFVVVTEAKKRRALMEAANNQKFVAEAPVVIACCAETDEHVMRCGQLCYPIDVSIAIDHLTLAAVALGLGTCWIGSFYPDKVRSVLNIPESIKVVELLTLGYPADSPKKKNRKLLDEICFYEEWHSDAGKKEK
jgi:nitroreductase